MSAADEFDEELPKKTKAIDFFQPGKLSFVLDHEAPVVAAGKNCRGELMRHQGACIWLLNELEQSRELHFTGLFGFDTLIRTNRYKVESPMGSGKTKLAIGLVLHSPRPAIKPIYYSDSNSEHPIFQERIFPEESIIWPTVIAVRSSIYSQWMDQIAEFSTLRVFQVCDSRSVIAFINAALGDLPRLNSQYDIILIDYKTISGKVDLIIEKFIATFDTNTKKQKHTIPLIMNALTRRCFARIIYDDSEYHMKAAVFENAISCIYLSAKHDYGTKTGAARYNLKINDSAGVDEFKIRLEHQGYTFDHNTFSTMVTVEISQDFVTESMNLGISDRSLQEIAAGPVIKKMIPPEPEVWLCPVVNTESKVIDIINCLCDDAKIMESVNNLTVTSFADVIRTLMAGRFEIYQAATKILDHYESMDLGAIADLPKPPEGLSFTVENLKRCEPIVYAWRDLANRIIDLIAEQKKIIADEQNLLARIQSNLAGAECPICLDSLHGDTCAIMRCCNQVMHIRCILHVIQRRCAYCRTPYGKTGDETFVPMHHSTDYSMFAEAKNITTGMSAIVNDQVAATPKNVELTKLSVLYDIVSARWDSMTRQQIRLRKSDAIIYDSAVEAKTEGRPEKLKILVYSSADDTLKKIEIGMPIQHAHLTQSASATFAKIKRFRNAEVASAILANSWRDAAGIDFKTATDVVIMNYVGAIGVVQQMVGRVQRMGRVDRARIWLIAYNNECDLWMNNHCEPLVGQEAPAIAAGI